MNEYQKRLLCDCIDFRIDNIKPRQFDNEKTMTDYIKDLQELKNKIEKS